MNDKYVKVRAVLIVKTRDAICIDCTPDSTEITKAWVPLSLIHAADERNIGNDHSTDMVEFRMREWKALELGL